jgi:hypothetical protein
MMDETVERGFYQQGIEDFVPRYDISFVAENV